MSEADGVIFGPKAVEQLGRAVRDNENRMMNPRGHRGRWQFHGSSGGGAERIWFTIISVDCSATPWVLTVEPTYYSGGCTASIPGADSYGYVPVEDFCGIAAHYTKEWLESGKSGSASYAYPRTGACVPVWLLDDICGEVEC